MLHSLFPAQVSLSLWVWRHLGGKPWYISEFCTFISVHSYQDTKISDLYLAYMYMVLSNRIYIGHAMTCNVLVSPSIVLLSQYDTRWKYADKITGYTDRFIYIPLHIKIRPRPTLERRTQESEPTPGKLVDDLDITASPCHVDDSWYNAIYSLIHPTPYLHLNLWTCAP